MLNLVSVQQCDLRSSLKLWSEPSPPWSPTLGMHTYFLNGSTQLVSLRVNHGSWQGDAVVSR